MPSETQIDAAAKAIQNGMAAKSLPDNWTYRAEARAALEAGGVDQLRDALAGLIDWCKEGCPDGGAFALVEARAALSGIGAASVSQAAYGQHGVRE